MFDLPKYGDGVCLARMAELLDALAIDRARLEDRSAAITGWIGYNLGNMLDLLQV